MPFPRYGDVNSFAGLLRYCGCGCKVIGRDAQKIELAKFAINNKRKKRTGSK